MIEITVSWKIDSYKWFSAHANFSFDNSAWKIFAKRPLFFRLTSQKWWNKRFFKKKLFIREFLWSLKMQSIQPWLKVCIVLLNTRNWRPTNVFKKHFLFIMILVVNNAVISTLLKKFPQKADNLSLISQKWWNKGFFNGKNSAKSCSGQLECNLDKTANNFSSHVRYLSLRKTRNLGNNKILIKPFSPHNLPLDAKTAVMTTAMELFPEIPISFSSVGTNVSFRRKIIKKFLWTDGMHFRQPWMKVFVRSLFFFAQCPKMREQQILNFSYFSPYWASGSKKCSFDQPALKNRLKVVDFLLNIRNWWNKYSFSIFFHPRVALDNYNAKYTNSIKSLGHKSDFVSRSMSESENKESFHDFFFS